MNFNGFYRSIQNSYINRLNRKPLMPDQKLQIYGYGQVTKPFYINYGRNATKAKIKSLDYTDSKYMIGSTNLQYTSDLLDTGKGGNDSGF